MCLFNLALIVAGITGITDVIRWQHPLLYLIFIQEIKAISIT